MKRPSKETVIIVILTILLVSTVVICICVVSLYKMISEQRILETHESEDVNDENPSQNAEKVEKDNKVLIILIDELTKKRIEIETIKGQTVFLPIPICDGYSFEGWLSESNYTYSSAITAYNDITLLAHWKTDRCTIRYISILGSNDTSVDFGAEVVLPYYDESNNKVVGWFDEYGRELLLPGAIISVYRNYEFSAKYESIYEQLFYVKDGTLCLRNNTQISAIPEVLEIPERIDDEIVETISSNSFFGCENTVYISLPSTIKTIENSAFKACSKLKTITINKENPFFASVDGVLFNKNLSVLIKYPEGREESSYRIPDSVRKIAPYAFSSCLNITTIQNAQKIEEIGEKAFAGCRYLTNIVLSSRIEMGNDVFDGCISLGYIKVGDIGLGGGVIFYDKGFESDGWRYLEAFLDDQSTYQYGYFREKPNGSNLFVNRSQIKDESCTSIGVGSGKLNTEMIFNSCGGEAFSSASGSGKITNYAASICLNMTNDGCDDWFLPSMEELQLLYSYLSAKSDTQLDFFVWSSTEGERPSGAKGVNFKDGSSFEKSRAEACHIIPIRAF